MLYKIYNTKSNKGKTIEATEDMVDVITLGNDFYKNLKEDDEVELYGGDGSLNVFVNNCKYVLPKITLMKYGTGNDLYKCLDEEYKTINIYKVNDTRFCNGFGAGFDALVCKLTEEAPDKKKSTFIKSVYKGLRQTELIDVNLEVDGKVYDYKGSFLLVTNSGKYIGGGMQICPDADPSKEELEMCCIHNGSKLKLALLFPTVFSAKHVNIQRNVKTLKGKEFKLKLSSPSIYQTDGEVGPECDTFVVKKDTTLTIRRK
ncbi:MAG: diacylglycerol/lipid kinase family protein [Mycoplasmatales bacterium]